MRNKRVVSMIKKLLSEQKVMSTEEIHGRMVDKKYCPSRKHLGTILASLNFVVSDETFSNEHGSIRNLWRLKDETPTDN